MVVVVRAGATPGERAAIEQALADMQAATPSGAPTVAAANGEVYCLSDGDLPPEAHGRLSALPGVARVVQMTTPYHLASRALHPEKTTVTVGDVTIGAGEPVVIAGPCSVESAEQIQEAALAAKQAGAQVLRGGAFKPRTSPYSFQGLGLPGLEMMAHAGKAAGLPIVTEVMEPGLVETVAEYADILQIGSRNMQNYPLLRAAGRAKRPILLKRGFAATIEEWLLAAEYILLEGNAQVILCERGVRGFDPLTRNLLDLACVPLLGRLTHLPALVDPSHATGRRELVVPMGVAAIAAGADGLLVEMHPHPADALTDAAQAIDPDELATLVRRAHAVHQALG